MDSIKVEVSRWIETEHIAELILENLDEDGIPATVENAKKVWYDFLLTELSCGIRASINALINKGEFNGNNK